MNLFIHMTAAAVALVFSGSGASWAQEVIGQDAFLTNCAVCHGTDGRGNGPILDFLKNAPADLAKISERNGGRFPIQEIYDTIANADSNPAHGTSEMPVWGDRFNMAIITQEGEHGMGKSGMPTAQAQALELVFFLATIQDPS